jgi:hypothetical protein
MRIRNRSIFLYCIVPYVCPPLVKGGVIVVMFSTVILWPQGGGRGEDAPSLYIFDIFASLSPKEDPRCVQGWLSSLYLLFKLMTSFLDSLRVVPNDADEYTALSHINSQTPTQTFILPLQLTSADTIEKGRG